MSEKCLYFNNLNVFLNGLNYCVDMLRLSCKITKSVFEKKISSRLFIYKDKIKEWTSTKISDFYYNYNYFDDNCSFWFGFISNKEKLEGKNNNNFSSFNFTIEFNPNKVKDNKFLLHILDVSTDWVVRQADFAVDVTTNINNICGFDKGRKDFLMTYDRGGSDKTFYIGKGNNRVKVYNKTIESDLDYDLTRIEVTKYFDNLKLKDVCSYTFDGVLPKLFFKDFQLSLEDFNDKTLFGLIYAVNAGFPLHNLTRHYRSKVETFYKNKNSIVDIEFKGFNNCFFNYIKYYFPGLV